MTFRQVIGGLFLIGGLLVGTISAHAASDFAVIELRLIAKEAEGGIPVPVEGSGKSVAVEQEALMGPADFESVGDVEWVEGRPGFNVALTADGARKYMMISTDNVGRTLAVIVDGEVLMTPRILDPVTMEGFLLTTQSEAEARTLAEKIHKALTQDE